MAALGRFGQALRSSLLNKNTIGVTTTRNAAYWNKDWKPGPYPKTPAEREAAAKKYGLRPEDYEPYPDDGMGYGDYPKLPRVATESKDGFELYDIPELKRNYGEPMHVDSDAMVEDRWNPTTRQQYSFRFMKIWLGSLLFITIGTYYLLDDYPHYLPALPKQYPGKGGPHYKFEAAE